jgi:hypothetical protein
VSWTGEKKKTAQPLSGFALAGRREDFELPSLPPDLFFHIYSCLQQWLSLPVVKQRRRE